MIVLRQVRAHYLQTYQEFPVVDRVRMPNCIDDSTLEREYEVRHENWEVLVDYSHQEPDSRLQSAGFSQS